MAMVMRRRSSFRRSGRPLRARVWRPQAGNLFFSATPEDPDCLVAPLLITAQIADLEDPTLVRVRGFWDARVIVAGANSTPVYVYVGIGVQNQAAVTAGALPCPYTNGDWGGWLWQAQAILQTANPAISNLVTNPVTVVDARGKRKLQEDDELFFAAELVSRPTDTDINIVFALRHLFLNG